MLQVESNNTAAVELYHQCGFETISHPWCQISLMRRPLRDELGETARQPQRAAHVSKNEHEEPALAAHNTLARLSLLSGLGLTFQQGPGALFRGG